jgi:hypothetical protein
MQPLTAGAWVAAAVLVVAACSDDTASVGTETSAAAQPSTSGVSKTATGDAAPSGQGTPSVAPEDTRPDDAPCVDPVAAVATTTTRDAAYGEALDLVLVDNVQLDDDIIELLVGPPTVLGPGDDADLRLPPDTLAWRVAVEARQISGSPAVSVYDLQLSDDRGRACTLHSVGSGPVLLAPGRAQRESTVLVFLVPQGAAGSYELSLLEPRTREVLVRWR